MIRAFLYLTTRSAANLVRSRLGRLRQPRYLIGAVFGGAVHDSVILFCSVRQLGFASRRTGADCGESAGLATGQGLG